MEFKFVKHANTNNLRKIINVIGMFEGGAKLSEITKNTKIHTETVYDALAFLRSLGIIEAYRCKTGNKKVYRLVK